MKWIAAFCLLVSTVAYGETSSTPPQLPGRVSIAQKLGTKVPFDVMMHDEDGRVVRLGDYFRRGRPVLLNFVYFRCPMLCPMVLEGMTSALTELKYNIGNEFDIVTISIDPRDKPSTAAEFKDKYVKRYGRLDAASGWHFLTSNDDTSIHRIADAVGFQYAYDGVRDQFAHGAAILVLTPDGRTSRYFYGFEFKPRDLRLAVVEASGGKVGKLTDQFLLLCYHYDPAVGRYSRRAMNFVRAGGITTVAVLASFIFIMVRKERRSRNV
ncbi:MAG TPA: SCO family protein [Thermoanaerobaculia bacterium]|nr:SCO family protein [Thermoanaerobaculia bacterium]